MYVKCVNVSTAVAAVNALHGRWFAGFSPSWFILSHFTPLKLNREPIPVFPGKVITAAYVPVVNYHNLFPGAQLFRGRKLSYMLNPDKLESKLNHFSCRLGQPFCQSALAQMNFLPLSLKRVVVDEFKSRIFSPHPDVDMFLPQLMEFGRNLNRCVLKPMRLVQHFHVVLDS